MDDEGDGTGLAKAHPRSKNPESLRRRASYSVILGRGKLSSVLGTVEKDPPANGESERPKKDSLEKAIFRGNFARVQRVVRAGADVNRPMSNGLTPLMVAVNKGERELTRYLVKNGADVNAEGQGGTTALVDAIIKGDREMVTELISLGADLNQANEADETPLMEALYSEAPPEVVFHIVDLLLKCGADPDHRSEATDETPRNLALKSKKPEIVWLFKKEVTDKHGSSLNRGTSALGLKVGAN